MSTPEKEPIPDWTEDSSIIAAVTQAMREADPLFETTGGGTRHYVRDLLLPIMQKAGLVVAYADKLSQPFPGLRFVNGSERKPKKDYYDEPSTYLVRIKGDDPRSGWVYVGYMTLEQIRTDIMGDYWEWLEETTTPSVQPIEGEQKTGIYLIAQERREQIEKHGRTLESDRLINPDGQLCWAASMLLVTEDQESPMDLLAGTVLKDWNQKILMKMSAKPYKDRLIIAGALIAAEIDRLQNAQPAIVPEAHPIDGEQKLKVGDLVMLDREFNNAGPVRLIRLDKYYSTVSDGGSTWDVMSNRLSIITPAPEAQPIESANMLQVRQYCEEHHEHYFGYCPKCPQPVFTTSTTAVSIDVTALPIVDKEVPEEIDLRTGKQIAKDWIKKWCEDWGSVSMSTSATGEIAMDMWEMMDKKLANNALEWIQKCNSVIAAAVSATDNLRAELSIAEKECDRQESLKNSCLSTIEDQRKAGLAANIRISTDGEQIAGLRAENKEWRDKYIEIESVLVELMDDVRNKPNDTRYASHMKKAQTVIDKYSNTNKQL